MQIRLLILLLLLLLLPPVFSLWPCAVYWCEPVGTGTFIAITFFTTITITIVSFRRLQQSAEGCRWLLYSRRQWRQKAFGCRLLIQLILLYTPSELGR